MSHTFAAIQQEIASMLDVADEELTEEQRATMDAYLNELGQQEAEKVDSFAAFIRIQTAMAKALKEEAKYLSGRAKTIENRIDGLKAHYQHVMTMNNLTKIAGTTHTISLRNNKSVAVSETVIDSLPDEYKKVTIEPRKTEIKKALEAGVVLEGCKIVETQSLNIR